MTLHERPKPDNADSPPSAPLEAPSTLSELRGVDTVETLIALLNSCSTQMNAKIGELTRTLPSEIRSEIAKSGENAAAKLRAAFELRLEQLRNLQAGKWEHGSSLILSSYIDLANDNFMEASKAGSDAWKTFTKQLLGLIEQANKPSSKPPSAKTATEPASTVELLEKASLDIEQARALLHPCLKRIRALYNLTETELVAKHSLNESDASMLSLFRDSLASNPEMTQRSRNALGKTLEAVKKSSANGNSSASLGGTAANMASRTGSHASQAEINAKRTQALHFLNLVGEHLDSIPLSPEQRGIALDAFELGARTIQSLIFLTNPPSELLSLWQRNYLEKARHALEAVKDTSLHSSLSLNLALLGIGLEINL